MDARTGCKLQEAVGELALVLVELRFCGAQVRTALLYSFLRKFGRKKRARAKMLLDPSPWGRKDIENHGRNLQ
jgi:hypothetical protein